jgi:enoyl-CoA hydratase/carnithine racemase
MMDDLTTVNFERRGHVAIVTLNRPKARNAYDDTMQGELSRAWREVRANPDIWVAVVTGAGSEAFCAGRDVKELAAFQQKGELVPRYDPRSPTYGDFGAHLHKFGITKPIVAAVNGFAIGGGLNLMLGCDLRIMSETAWLGDLHVNIGQVGGAGRILRQLPYAVAAELVLAGERIGAARAREVGLVNKVVPPDCVLPEALALAEQICRMSPLAVARSKEILQALMAIPAGTDRLEEFYMAQQRLTEDGREGPAAFREKRAPRWTGR